MKKIFIITCTSAMVFLLLISMHVNAAEQMPIKYNQFNTHSDSLPNEETFSGKAWTKFGEDGSIQFSAETIQLLTDTEYRTAKYPETYDAFQVADLLDAGDVPFALWTIINLYKVQPEQVRVIAFKLAEHGIRGNHYLNAFYTYAFADPDIMDYMNAAKPYLGNPQRLEEKLWSCRTLAAYTDKVIELQTGDK